MEVSSFNQVQHEKIDPPGTHFNEVVIAHIFTEKKETVMYESKLLKLFY